ncbi:MAG: Bacterioferritin comigratory protein thiol peroxidase [Candidatus Saccharibacteria bacterium]|nr:Bacterioferritin comigratory protein thiol peroxidase [Candidatus Saccharibacteria bacterium]
MRAPAFTLPDQDGRDHSLTDYAGRWLVLYFYPEDDTPGCTTEACSFRDGRDALAEAGAAVVGISADSVKSHRKFADKYGLSFPILSDRSHATIKAYDAWRLGFAKRKTFLISPDSEIAKEYPKVTPDAHAEEVLSDIRALSGGR